MIFFAHDVPTFFNRVKLAVPANTYINSKAHTLLPNLRNKYIRNLHLAYLFQFLA